MSQVETIGDCYMVAGNLVRRASEGSLAEMDAEAGADGLHGSDPGAAHAVFGFAQALLQVANNMRMPNTGEALRMRVGLHTG